jgi:hypothetical protein
MWVSPIPRQTLRSFSISPSFRLQKSLCYVFSSIQMKSAIRERFFMVTPIKDSAQNHNGNFELWVVFLELIGYPEMILRMETASAEEDTAMKKRFQ